jgi:hypothetical protein
MCSWVPFSSPIHGYSQDFARIECHGRQQALLVIGLAGNSLQNEGSVLLLILW